jgi:hypothetical protein
LLVAGGIYGIVIGGVIFTHFEMGKSPMRATVDVYFEVPVFTPVQEQQL